MTEKTRNKIVYKQNTLEIYAAKGYLDFGNPKFTSIDRVSAGNRLYRDFYLSGLTSSGAVNPEKIKVDGGGNLSLMEKKAYHEDMYLKAVKIIPSEFWEAVRVVVIEDKFLSSTGSDRQINKELYLKKVDLCRGLDRLIEFYIQGC